MIDVIYKGRLCKGTYTAVVDNRVQTVTFDKGYFHQWGVESTEYETGGVTDTVAIVELENGTVVTVVPRLLVFT